MHTAGMIQNEILNKETMGKLANVTSEYVQN